MQGLERTVPGGVCGSPRLVRRERDAVLMVDGEPFVALGGEVHNSCSSSEREFSAALSCASRLGMNTVLAPVTWELLEPEEGSFDYKQVDMMVERARDFGMRLILLWFGAWKNAQCYYAPGWVKCDLERFPRAEMKRGCKKLVLEDFHDFPYSALSLFSDETRRADARAFARLMAHVRDIDEAHHTVVMVQVENECGEMGAAREHSQVADEAFSMSVPDGLLQALLDSGSSLARDVAEAIKVGSEEGTWEEVFGSCAEELFTAYHMASYVEAVAAAGRREYDLPLLANCWLDKGHKPGRFPTGGPVARVMEVWRFAAPSIDVLAPDIYVPTFCSDCDAYRKLDNPLCVPETATHAYASSRMMWTVGHHHALCFAPFGFEEMGEPFDGSEGVLFGMDTGDPALGTPQDPVEYASVARGLSALVQLAPDAVGTELMDAVTSERPEVDTMVLGGIGIRASYDCQGLPGACVGVVGPDGAVYLLANRCSLEFVSANASLPHVDVIRLEDGLVKDGSWVANRRLNGDELAILRFDEPTLLRLETFNYA